MADIIRKTDICYPGQPEDEQTLAVVFKYWPYLVPGIIAFLLLVGGGLALVAVGILKGILIALSGTLIFLLGFFFGLAILWIWKNNMMLITNQHIVDVDQYSLFSKSVSTLQLSQVQDVKATVVGFSQTILNYGVIEIQTAGEKENFYFDYIKNPYRVKTLIIEIHQKFLQDEKNSKHQNSPE